MRPITISGFHGANIALDERLLPDTVGVDSQNARPGHSDLRPWNNPSTVASVPSGTARQTIHRMGQDVASSANYWFQWTTVVHAIRGFENPDTSERTYFTGSGGPKWTDNSMGLTGGPPYPQATRDLGVPTPTTGLTATQHTAGTGTDEVHYWVYTWVNDLGWESAPSPVSNVLTIKPGATVDLSGWDTVPAGNWGISKVRLYKTVTGSSGATSFFFLREWALGSTPANPVDDARAVGSDTLPTIGWIVPPSDSSCLTKMWNGMAALITGKAVRVCEPYKLYTYPLKYEIETPDQPLALAVWQQKMLILSSGDVYRVEGTTPSALNADPQKLYQPLASVRGVVEFEDGVAWPTPNGLWWYGNAGAINLLAGIMTREQWQALQPSTIVASRYLGFYIGFYNDGGGYKGFVIDPRNPTGIYWLSTSFSAVHRDALQDKLYGLNGTSIQEFNVAAAGAMTTSFKSKRFRQLVPFSVGAVEVIAAAYPVTINLYADGSLWHTQIVYDGNPIRPPDKQAQEWACNVSGSNRVIAVRLARSVADLMEP